jgi:hypothetical protein
MLAVALRPGNAGLNTIAMGPTRNVSAFERNTAMPAPG